MQLNKWENFSIPETFPLLSLLIALGDLKSKGQATIAFSVLGESIPNQ